MPAATHRKAIPASRQRLTLRVTRSNGAHHVLGDVGTGERSTKLLRQLQPDDSQDFVEAFEDAGRYAGPLLVESTREIADQFFSLIGVIELPGLAQHPTGGRMMPFRQALHDVARLVDLAALDRSGRTEGAADRLRQRFRAVDDEQSWHRRGETSQAFASLPIRRLDVLHRARLSASETVCHLSSG